LDPKGALQELGRTHLSGFTFDGADFTVFTSADGLDQLTMSAADFHVQFPPGCSPDPA
jgi:hypothetical protein